MAGIPPTNWPSGPPPPGQPDFPSISGQPGSMPTLPILHMLTDFSVTANPSAVAPVIPGNQLPIPFAPLNNTAVITVSGAPPNAPLTASVTALPFSGGHQHDSALTFRPIGTVSGVPATTDGSGGAQFTYTSNIVGGEEFVNVFVGTSSGNVKIPVTIPGLTKLGRNDALYLTDSGDPAHPVFTYGSAHLIDAVTTIAAAYISTYTARLSINDMSLINGGLFDSRGTWATPHISHRIGIDVDFNHTITDVINGKTKKLTTTQLVTNIQNIAHLNCFPIQEADSVHFRCL